MRYLIDTHLLVWAMGSPERLPNGLAALLDAPDTTPVFNVASLWELMQKHALRRPGFQLHVSVLRRALLDCGWDELPILPAHVLALSGWSHSTRDPFDGLLVAQADCEGILLISADPEVGGMPGPVRWMPVFNA
jgi:PIN domain nuclease of toxin-antitoxin system